MSVNNNKVIAIVVGAVAALLALSFVVRFVLLSQYGFSGGWIFFALPFGGIGVLVLLLRLGVINAIGRSSGTSLPLHYNVGVQAPPPASPPPAPGVSQRLQELESMRASGAISESEYATKRQQILSAL
jgi:Short C-terminal domain